MKEQYRIIVRESGRPDYEELYEADRALVAREVVGLRGLTVAIVEIESEPGVGKPGVALARRMPQVHG